MPTMTCPGCGSHLEVDPNAPRAVTCPQCLHGILNPFAGGEVPVGTLIDREAEVLRVPDDIGPAKIP